MILLADLSPQWNNPNLKRLHDVLFAMSGEEPGIIIQLSQGTFKHPSAIDMVKRGRDAGFVNIGGYHFYRPEVTPTAQANAFLEQLIKFPFTVRHSGDFEKSSVYPTASYEGDVSIWYDLIDTELKAPGMVYSSLSWITTYFLNPAWHIHPLWLSYPPSNTNYKYLIGSPPIPLPWLFVAIHQESFYNFLGSYFGDTGNNHIDLNKAYWLPKAGTGTPNPNPDPDPTPTTRKSIVIVNNLNIRSGPGAEYPATGFLSYGNIIIVLESSSSPNAPTEWVRHSRGWSAHHTTSGVYMQDLP